MTDAEDILDELAADLQANPPCQGRQTTQITINTPQNLDEDTVKEAYVNNQIQQTNDILVSAMKQFAQDVGDDPERADALSKLIDSNTKLLKLVNDQIIKSRDNKTKVEVEKIKQQSEVIKDAIEKQQNIVASRDSVFKEILKDAQDVDLEEVEDEDQE